MIAAYSPEARGRFERAFATHQGRLSKELALAGITDMSSANCYLQDVCCLAVNAEFTQPPLEDGRHSCLFREEAWTTSCANNSSAPLAKTTVCVSRD